MAGRRPIATCAAMMPAYGPAAASGTGGQPAQHFLDDDLAACRPSRTRSHGNPARPDDHVAAADAPGPSRANAGPTPSQGAGSIRPGTATPSSRKHNSLIWVHSVTDASMSVTRQIEAGLCAGPDEGWPRSVTAGALPPGSRKVSYLRLRMPAGLWVVRLGGCDRGRGAAAGVARLAWRGWWAMRLTRRRRGRGGGGTDRRRGRPGPETGCG
jgi:hypothetical protein